MGFHLVLAAALAAAPAPAALPDTGAALPAPSLAPDPDYLFGHPRGTIGVRFGRTFARADSDVFDQTMDLFTLDRGDFDAFTFGVDVTSWVTESYDALISVTYSRSSANSEYIDWVGSDDLPIEQETRLSQLMASLGLKVYPTSRGRAVGQLAWIPRRMVPYVGLTGGLLRYSFEQSGEFIRFQTEDFDIVEDEVTTGGWTPVGQLLAGVELGLTSDAVLLLESRFTAASASPSESQDFRGFDRIDLMGLQATAGVALRF